MQIVITPSDKPTKKFEARIDGQNLFTLEVKVMKTLPYTKTLRGRTDILTDIQKMKTGIIP